MQFSYPSGARRQPQQRRKPAQLLESRAPSPGFDGAQRQLQRGSGGGGDCWIAGAQGRQGHSSIPAGTSDTLRALLTSAADMDVVPEPSAEVDASRMTLASDGTVLAFKEPKVKDAMFRLGITKDELQPVTTHAHAPSPPQNYFQGRV